MKQTIDIHIQARLKAAKAHALIRQTTDDKLVLWLASDALEQAEHELRSAIVYANATETASSKVRTSLQLKLLLFSVLKKYIAVLRWFPPQTIFIPLVLAHLCLMFFGTPWLLFGLHIHYAFVLPFVLVNIVAMPFIWSLPDKHAIWLMDKAMEFAETAEHAYHSLFLTHPSIQDRIGWASTYTTFPKD